MKRCRYNLKLKSLKARLSYSTATGKGTLALSFCQHPHFFPLDTVTAAQAPLTAQVRQHQYITNRIARQILLIATARNNILSACETDSVSQAVKM